jgi:hypothetical protein
MYLLLLVVALIVDGSLSVAFRFFPRGHQSIPGFDSIVAGSMIDGTITQLRMIAAIRAVARKHSAAAATAAALCLGLTLSTGLELL